MNELFEFARAATLVGCAFALVAEAIWVTIWINSDY